MPNKLKIKTDGIVSKGDIPDDTEELEINCKVIGKEALADHEALRSVTLINTEVIGEEAFRDCRALKNIKLPETLREIGDRAFEGSHIKCLAIPPSVTEIGEYILRHNFFYSTIEVYLKNGVLPVKPEVQIAENGTLLIVRSYETNKILCQFSLFGSPYEVFTEHGIDFTEYDKMFNDPDHYCGFGPTLRAAHCRLLDPVGMNEETLELFKDYVSDNAAYDVSERITRDGYTASDIAEYPYLDDIDNKRFLNLIGYSAQERKPEIAEALIQILCNRSVNISENDLMELIDYSAQQGATEITALLMQKLHERRSRNNNE